MKPLYILKIGGSVATYKNRPGFSVRSSLLKKIAISIREAQKKENFDLILIHGAGAAGHQLAKQYGLQRGTGKNQKKMHGAFLSRFANQKLDIAVAESLYEGGLKIVSVHTASIIIQKNGKITKCDLKTIRDALDKECIPLLYGEMAFDEELGMTICSGDAIAPYLAKELYAKKIFFASDAKGIFDKDPHIFKNVRLIEKISIKDIEKNVELSNSHNVDATDGMRGKIKNIKNLIKKSVKSVEIFDGHKVQNYKKVFLSEKFPHTVIQK
ncbi:MAG TPA: isopentenyl phosphate kinase [Candidatus Saccharimonadales bacterium]|nr:isopentenyl phosphate kinase [Candidatus Saccharimonadales bacterium]